MTKIAISSIVCLICSWGAVPASGQVCNPPCQPGQTCFSGCGTIFQGVECLLFQADTGAVYLLDNHGGFNVGDRVEVTGCAEPCVTICQQGNGCVSGNTIASCPEVLGRCCFIGFVFPPYICQEMPQERCANTVGGIWTSGATCATPCDDTPDTDSDDDGIPDRLDNCPTTANADQADSDGNGVGDVCEPPPADQTTTGGCVCGSGIDGIMVMPMTLLGIGWMRRRSRRRIEA